MMMSFLFSPLPRLAIIIRNIMPKDIAYIAMSDDYPFPQKGSQPSRTEGVQVKKTIEYDQQSRSLWKERIRMLKSLGFQNLIGLQTTKSEENSAILFFQYVPLRFLSEAASLPQEKMSKLQEGMLELCQELSTKGIVHELDVKRVGLDKRFNLKYYLGVDFKIDRMADKEILMEEYRKKVMGIFREGLKNDFQGKVGEERKDKDEPVKEDLQCSSPEQMEYTINVKEEVKNEGKPRKRLLKKSSIIASTQKDEDQQAKRASSRFTFNHDKHINLPLLDKDEANLDNKSTMTKSGKNLDLMLRINNLKNHMKDISLKVGMKNKEDSVKTNDESSNSQKNEEKKVERGNALSIIEKKITQIRLSKLTKASSGQTTPSDRAKPQEQTSIQASFTKKHEQSERSTRTQKKTSSPTKNKTNLFSTVSHMKPPQGNFAKKNSIDICDNDRQHQEYLMLANKDKYCQEFMLFLESEETASTSHTIKKSPEKTTKLLPAARKESQDQPKQQQKRQTLKTQSSQNTLQIQSRVQKVIKSSLRLISGLRSRQSIRCG